MARIKNLMLAEQEVHSDEVISVPGQVLYPQLVVVQESQVTEFADHLHEHFIHPAVTEKGAYKVPMSPGYSAEMKKESLDAYEYPTGSEWQKLISNGLFESKFESSG
ncbi:Mitochondrial enolase superfamily member 1 [Acropora cervicornis]|uniref:Mitochondrial enolase superfamily member 1 n=1 Tax=Acropora cervicornis TaxID=6130 RepID=A0AAD9Q2Z8_ACRCE|nr:Mitochondrial enolase superfamily member 1 [Acropora cervicornis]